MSRGDVEGETDGSHDPSETIPKGNFVRDEPEGPVFRLVFFFLLAHRYPGRHHPQFVFAVFFGERRTEISVGFSEEGIDRQAGEFRYPSVDPEESAFGIFEEDGCGYGIEDELKLGPIALGVRYGLLARFEVALFVYDAVRYSAWVARSIWRRSRRSPPGVCKASAT